MVETFCIAAGHHDFKGLEKGHMMVSLQSATKGGCHSAEPLVLYSSLQCLPFFYHFSGQLVEMFACSSCLVPPRVRGKLHAMRTLALPGFLLLINMVVRFYISEKTYDFGLGRESGNVSSELWYVYGLDRQPNAMHPAIQQLPILPISCGCGAWLWEALAVISTCGQCGSLSTESSQQPSWEASLPFSLQGKKWEQRGETTCPRPCRELGDVLRWRLCGTWQNSFLVWAAQTMLVSDSKASIMQYIFCMSSLEF